MNVNELINKLKLVRCLAGDGQVLNDTEAMLRQQQAEIEALKAENSHLKYEISSGAWNPAELTDEEITEIVADKYEKGHGRYIDTDLFFIEFARAILRKAQEK
jgi:hypothetical protein